MPTPSRSGIPSSRSHAEHWESYGIIDKRRCYLCLPMQLAARRKPILHGSKPIKVWQGYSECLEMGPIKINFVQISGHFSWNSQNAFTSLRAMDLQLL